MEWGIPNRPDVRFRIGSITKQFTAALVLKLAEEGLLDVEDPVSTHLPDYPRPQGDRVTLHHHLAHTSGIPSYTGFPDFGEEYARNPFTPDSLVAIFSKMELEFEPGADWNYSNSGYFLLGYIIEQVTGEPYDEALRTRLLDPLGLDDTGCDHHAEVIERRAAGYVRTPAGYENAAYLDTSLPGQVNRLGYLYLDRGDTEQAIAVFELNVEAYPDAFNTYDSLGEAYMEAGRRELAIANYRKSLELIPQSETRFILSGPPFRFEFEFEGGEVTGLTLITPAGEEASGRKVEEES